MAAHGQRCGEIVSVRHQDTLREWSGFSSKVVCFFLKHIHLIQTYSHVIHVDSLIRKENLFQMLFTFILAFIRVIRL